MCLVSLFARHTGDFSVLSQTDLRVLALTYDLEVLENGLLRVREKPGAETQLQRQRREEREFERQAAAQKADEEAQGGSTESADGAPEASGSTKEPESTAERAGATDGDEGSTPVENDLDDDPSASSDESESASDEEDDQDSESDSDGGEWITPSNVQHVKATGSSKSISQPPPPPGTIKAACITGDFAMQNVGIQMGLNIVGVGGRRITQVKTWVLRCHACFKYVLSPLVPFTVPQDSDTLY
jgi:RNA-binding protein NOB1